MLVFILFDKYKNYRGVFQHLEDAKAWAGRDLTWKKIDICIWKADEGWQVQEQAVY